MGKPSDDQETKTSNRFGWVNSLIHKDSPKKDPILPVTNSSQDGAGSANTNTEAFPQVSHSSSSDTDAFKSAVPDNTSTARPAAAPPPDHTQVASEESAAIDQTDTQEPKIPLSKRAKAGAIRFGRHTKGALLHSWINVLLIFVPLGIAVKAANLDPSIIFAMNAVAIVPLAGLLAHATESVAGRLGDALGALLNVSFGNAVELIIFIALVKNEIRIVQASLLGSILANLLLILGMAFAAGGLRYREQIYNSTVTQMSAVMLSLSVMSLLLPTAFHASFSDVTTADRNTLKISRGTSVILLLVYILYLLFQLKSHAYLYASVPQARIDEESHPGVLADMLDSSTSSSSSDSSTTDSDDTSGSHNTATKRIKRYFRKGGRRKSSASSMETPSLPSHLSSPNLDAPASYFDDASRRPSAANLTLPDILSGDEGDTENGRGVVTRDFEKHHSGTTSPSPERKQKKKKKEKKHKFRHHGKRFEIGEPVMEVSEKVGESSTVNQQLPQSPNRTVGFVEDIPPPPATPNSKKEPKSLTLARPGLPKVFTDNVFTKAAVPALTTTNSRGSGPPLRRTNSLPSDLNHASTAVATATAPPRALPPFISRLPAKAPRPATSSTAGGEEVEEDAEMSRTAAVMMLLISTGLVAICAEFLVDAIPGMAQNSKVSQAFIGLIILPIVGNAAEHVTAVTVAAKNKMDLAIGVAVGSSIQIALFITPIVVILGWCMNKSMTLYFNLFETVSLFVTVFVVNFLVLDGRSNYLEGVLLISAYIIIAVCAFFYPDETQQSSLGGSDNKNITQVAMLMGRALTDLSTHL